MLNDPAADKTHAYMYVWEENTSWTQEQTNEMRNFPNSETFFIVQSSSDKLEFMHTEYLPVLQRWESDDI